MAKSISSVALLSAQKLLAESVSRFEVPRLDPLDVSPWVAMSLLQKAIRRGRRDMALQAAATLLARSPASLWRRCGGIAYEDVGAADLPTVSLVTAALSGKLFRTSLGGEWQVASFIVSQMAQAPKCRAADDLLMTAELHPACAAARRELGSMHTKDLLDIVTSTQALPERAIALLYAVGTTSNRSSHLRRRAGDPAASFEMLAGLAGNQPLIEITQHGYFKLREGLCPLLPLLWSVLAAETVRIEDDRFPPEAVLEGVPTWALDIYSREGRAALQAFLRQHCDTSRWILANVPDGSRIQFLGALVFRVEGGLLRQRVHRPTAVSLRELEESGLARYGTATAKYVLDLMRRDIPLLNGSRSHVW
jgi:hypothetical protein